MSLRIGVILPQLPFLPMHLGGKHRAVVVGPGSFFLKRPGCSFHAGHISNNDPTGSTMKAQEEQVAGTVGATVDVAPRILKTGPPSTSATMKALVFHGPGKRAWEDKPRPVIQEPGDAIVRITTSTICGTDLHILKGDVPSVIDGRILGH